MTTFDFGIFLYLKSVVTEKWRRERERYFSFTVLVFKYPKILGLGHAEARIQEPLSGLPKGDSLQTILAIIHCLPGTLTWRWIKSVEQQKLKPCSIWDAGITNSGLTPKFPPQSSLFKNILFLTDIHIFVGKYIIFW